MRVEEAFSDAIQRLKDVGNEAARTDARLLLGHVLGGGPERMLAEKGRDLNTAEEAAFESLISRRVLSEPVSQILGVREFWSLPFKVTAATLTPRPDTETLIEAALHHVSPAPKTILDLGTGSGCILLSLLSEWTHSIGTGVDASADALGVAEENAQTLGLADRSKLVLADWAHDKWMENLNPPFDVVVSNPPYILKSDMQGLDKDVRDFEPASALVGGGVDGLDAYRAIIRDLPHLLSPGGWILFEVGIDQSTAVAGLLKQAKFSVAECRKDLSGTPRVVVAQLN